MVLIDTTDRIRLDWPLQRPHFIPSQCRARRECGARPAAPFQSAPLGAQSLAQRPAPN